jgi:chemotaxis protein methyltransferase CheR
MSNIKKEINDADLTDVLDIVSSTYGFDFKDYARASIHRRVQRFMDDAGYRNAYDLKFGLINDREVFEQFLKRVTVNVTEMFRDAGFYRTLKEKVLPVLESYPIIKIWHAGCSSGEEVFSMAILLHEAGLLKRSKIYATDINPANLEKAKKGIMPLDVMKDYVSNYIKAGGESDFASYYTARYNNAIIARELREKVVFSQHNLVTDRVFNEFQLICCRNVMIYFNGALQNRVIRLFYESLSTFGYLALGVKESLLFTDIKDRFEAVSAQEKIFRRIR